MKTLKNHTILYDSECPMCSVYTKAFIQSRMLDEKGRLAYQKQPEKICTSVNMQRAVNEIALLNNITGEVKYGIHSLFAVLAHSFPFLKPLFAFAPFVWIMEKLYAFISYNRRVIIPADVQADKFGIQPSFRKDYRILFLLFTCTIVAVILTSYSTLLFPLFPAGNSYREFLVCFGQLLIQGMLATVFYRDKLWDYLGNMMTISFAGALLLLPVVIIAEWINLSPLFCAAYFMITVLFMLIEHIRRSKLLHVGYFLTASWMGYRLIVLLVILKISGYALF